jgi:hypothetical protein
MIDWVMIRSGCPYCGSSLQYHSLTIWYLRRGFGCNWEDWPDNKDRVFREAGRVNT